MVRNWYRMNELILYSGVSSSRLVLTIPLKKKKQLWFKFKTVKNRKVSEALDDIQVLDRNVRYQ